MKVLINKIWQIIIFARFVMLSKKYSVAYWGKNKSGKVHFDVFGIGEPLYTVGNLKDLLHLRYIGMTNKEPSK